MKYKLKARISKVKFRKVKDSFLCDILQRFQVKIYISRYISWNSLACLVYGFKFR